MNKKCFVKEASVFLVLTLIVSSVGAMAANTGSQTSSTSVKAVATTDELPDLTIKIKIYNITGDNYYIEIWIHNGGNGAIIGNAYITTRYFSTPEENICYYRNIPEGGSFNPGDTLHGIEAFPKHLFKGDVLTVVVDPPYYDGYPWEQFDPDPVYGLILESNETNNIFYCPVPNVKSYDSFSSLLSSLSSQTQSSNSQQFTVSTTTATSTATTSTTTTTGTSTPATTRQTSAIR